MRLIRKTIQSKLRKKVKIVRYYPDIPYMSQNCDEISQIKIVFQGQCLLQKHEWVVVPAFPNAYTITPRQCKNAPIQKRNQNMGSMICFLITVTLQQLDLHLLNRLIFHSICRHTCREKKKQKNERRKKRHPMPCLWVQTLVLRACFQFKIFGAAIISIPKSKTLKC